MMPQPLHAVRSGNRLLLPGYNADAAVLLLQSLYADLSGNWLLLPGYNADAAMLLMQSLYADLSGNVLLHASVPALGLRAEQWAIVSWGHTHAQLPDFADSRLTYRYAAVRFLSILDVLHHCPAPLPFLVPSSSVDPSSVFRCTGCFRHIVQVEARHAPPGVFAHLLLSAA
jgi:hypothetical protein